MEVIAVLPQSLEKEGLKEIESLGGTNVKALKRAVSFECDMACFYRLHLQARLPFRFLREIGRFKCTNPEMLYRGVQDAIDWQYWLHYSMSFRIDVSGTTESLRHSHFTALQVKNAIVDFQRQLWGKRSSVSLDKPDLSINLHLNNEDAVLSLNGSHRSLHKRGYRPQMGVAPLKENLAAGLIRLSEWSGSNPLVDPMCGAGTLIIEAARIALRIAPGINQSFAFQNWADFSNELWARELIRARDMELENQDLPIMIGCENNPKIAAQAKENIAISGLSNFIKIQNSHFENIILPENPGLIICNPPYGKRIGDYENLTSLYTELGDFLKRKASGWGLWLLSGDPKLSKFLKMKCNRRIPINNGGIDCRWLNYDIH